MVDRLSERWFGLPPRVRAALLVAAATVLLLATGVGAARSPWGPPVEVLVLVGDVDAGDPLGPADVRPERRPTGVVPDDAVRGADDLGDARAAGRLVAGTVLARRHLAGHDGIATGLAPDRAAFPVDAALLPPLVAGQRVDVVAGDVSGAGQVLSRDARVLAVTDGTVWLEVARPDAPALAGAAVLEGLRVVLLPPP